MLQAMAASAERIFEFLEEPEEVVTSKGNIDTLKLQGNVEFRNVKFGYDENKTIINNFNAQVKEGQKIAIVGPTGAGKTTMVKLLMRFYDVTDGEILVDGYNIKDFDRGELRKMFGMVLQDTWLFGGTVKENIKYSKEEATDTEVIEAAKAAHVHHFIKTLPKGYNSLINEESTNISALMRFYDVTDGEILVDGYNIKDFDRGELRKMFGMVLQDTWLFGGTVKENIKYSKEEATDTEVIEAAKAAHVHHFIKTLPKGYNSLINEESTNISAGQKQLLTIARVILADPKILILDEATSSIDTRTEIQIQSAMDNLMKGRTSFIIAHRLSTIKNADLILVMNHGDIVEQGTHEELLAKNGFYADLYNSQFDEEEE